MHCLSAPAPHHHHHHQFLRLPTPRESALLPSHGARPRLPQNNRGWWRNSSVCMGRSGRLVDGDNGMWIDIVASITLKFSACAVSKAKAQGKATANAKEQADAVPGVDGGGGGVGDGGLVELGISSPFVIRRGRCGGRSQHCRRNVRRGSFGRACCSCWWGRGGFRW